MSEQLKLMCVLAHPDDETLGNGGLIAKYAAEGVEVYLITATRGERGWMGDEKDDPGPETLGQIREAELMAAARILGIREVSLLDYVDGDLNQADPAEAIGKIVTHLRRVRPQVVTTFDPFGAYGHPDHIAICQFTHAAVVCAADSSYVDPLNQPPHRVSKLYWQADSINFVHVYEPIIGKITMPVDGEVREAVPFPEWAITTRLDAEAYWRTASDAAYCHKSQMVIFPPADQIPEEVHKRLWGHPTLYRAFSLVDVSRQVEHDVFEGLR
jgi:LmbE family N-acetylglucosaminyl deacetylase